DFQIFVRIFIESYKTHIMQEKQQSILTERAAYGTFWYRVASYILDCLVVSVPVCIVTNMLTFNYMPTDYVTFAIWIYGSLAGIFVLYYTIMEASKKQATVGKMAVNLKVTDLGGNRLSIGRSFARCMSKFLSFIILGIGFVMVAWDNKKQGLHDKITGTV